MQERTAVAETSGRDSPYAVEMRDISKTWPGVIANDHVNLTVRKGEDSRAGWRKRRGQVYANEYPLRVDSAR